MEPRFDPERQIEEARASLVAHLSELRERLAATRARVDLPAKIAAHPLASVGAAFALGALLGLRSGARRRERHPGERRIARLVVTALGALAVRIGKELALRGVAEAAHAWWEHRHAEEAEASMSGSRTAYPPGDEPYPER